MIKTLNDFVKKSKQTKYETKYNRNGIRIETEEEIENWKKI